MELTSWERGLLTRSMINEGNHYVPGWHWFEGQTDEMVEFFIQLVALSDPVENFRVAALRFLTANAPIARTHISDDELVTRLLVDQPEAVVTAALQYAARFCTGEIIEQITSLKDHELRAIADKAEEAIQSILVRSAPEKALERIITNPGSVNREVLDQLRGQHELGMRAIFDALQRRDSALRAFAAGELHARGILTEETARQLLGDSSGQVRAVGVRRLIELRKSPDPGEIRNLLIEVEPKDRRGFGFAHSEETVDPSDLVQELFRTHSYEGLEKKVDWFGLDGPIAYGVLSMLHFERWGNRVRSDLKDQFESFYEQEKQRLRNIYGEQAEAIIEAFSRGVLNRFTTAQFSGAALNGLFRYATRDDVELARPHLASIIPETKLAAVKLVAKVGNTSDVEPLVAVAKNSYGSVADQAAVAALDLSQDPWPLACRFLEDGNSALVDAAVNWLVRAPSITSWDTLEQFLYEKNAGVRMGVVRVFSARQSASELESLLDRYPKGSTTYYYDVNAYFDRALHAPKAWRPTNPKQEM